MREHQIGSLASHWRTTAALIAVGLGLLSAIPTGGSGLIAGVAAGAAVLGTAYSLATLYDDYQDYSLASAEHLSTLDQAEAISQEEPSLMWLAGDLLDVGLNIVGAASAFKTLRGAMVAAENGALKALPELIKTTERLRPRHCQPQSRRVDCAAAHRQPVARANAQGDSGGSRGR